MQDTSTLEKLQNEVAKMVTGLIYSYWLTHIENVVGSHYILDVKNKN